MSNNDSTPITAEALREIVEYNQDTGVFSYKVSTSRRVAGCKAGHKSHQGYISLSIRGRNYRAHRLAFLYMTGNLPSPELQVDHINGVRDDNRFSNLRIVTNSINAQNKAVAKRGSRTGFIGVCWHKSSKKYHAQIRLNGKSHHLGLFSTAEEAHLAYATAKSEMHPGSKRISKPDGVQYLEPRVDARLRSRTGVTGISKRQSGKYVAYICSGGKQQYVGHYDSLVDAVIARDAALARARGEATNG